MMTLLTLMSHVTCKIKNSLDFHFFGESFILLIYQDYLPLLSHISIY